MEKALQKEIEELVDAKFAAFKEELLAGGGLSAKKAAAKANPGFKPSYKPDADVDLIATAAAPHHEEGEKFTAKGHQATIFIRKGFATLDESKKK